MTSPQKRVDAPRVGAWILAGATLVAGCGSPEKAFIAGRAHDPCLQSIPACPGLTAQCALDTKRYTQAEFPRDSPLRFLVEAEGGTEITVRLFFKSQRDVGSDTRIYWNEPGCRDARSYRSYGVNLFEEAGQRGIIERAQTVEQSGDHLIEILTNMQATVLVATSLDK